MKIAFLIPGEPQGKQRPKFSTRGGGYVTAYTPAKTVAYEKLIKEQYLKEARKAEIEPWLNEEPLFCNIHVGYPIPKSTSKKNRARMLCGEMRPTKKPDIDNVAKIVLDGLNGIAYKDDKQVVELYVTSCFSEGPSVFVEIGECEND